MNDLTQWDRTELTDSDALAKREAEARRRIREPSLHTNHVSELDEPAGLSGAEYLIVLIAAAALAWWAWPIVLEWLG